MINPLKILFWLDRRLSRVEGFMLGLSLIVMLCFASLQVMLRNFFQTGISWGDVFIRHLVLFVLFFGASLSTKDKRHIQMDIAGKLVPKKGKAFFEIFLSIFCVVVTFFLFLAARKFMMDEKATGEMLFANVQTWMVIAIMPIGFSLIMFHFFMHLVEQLMEFSGQKKMLQDMHQDTGELEVSVKIKLH